MKIIHLVLGKANPNRMNGVNKVAHYHATYLHRLGVKTEIWGITRSPEAPVTEREVPTRLFRAQSIIRGLDPALMIAIEKLKGQTVFHIHGALIPDFYLVTKILCSKKIPYIYTPHGAFNEVALRKNRLIKKLYISGFEKWMLRHAKKVQFLGKSEFDHISNLVKLQNKVVIPNGQCFEELSFEYHQIRHKVRPVFGFCGRLDNYYKGLDLLVKAFSAYRNKGGKGELWIIGDGPDRQKLEQLVIAAELSASVTFYGARYGQEKLNFIANMDVFVHPSHSEGSPTAILEAAALKRPLLVTTGTNVGPVVEQYKAGLHISDNKPSTITKALQQFDELYASGALKEMEEGSFSMVQQEFSWKVIARKLADIYQS
jgi:glycosyltransferase involved in cell wall biosynthesis